MAFGHTLDSHLGLNVSLVFSAGLTTLSTLLCCFLLCCIGCIWPSRLIFFRSISSDPPHVMSPPSNLHWFLPFIHFFPFDFHLLSLPLFKLYVVFPFLLQLSCLPLSELHFWIPIVCIVSPFLQAENILEQAQLESTTLALQYLVGWWRGKKNYPPVMINIAMENHWL